MFTKTKIALLGLTLSCVWGAMFINFDYTTASKRTPASEKKAHSIFVVFDNWHTGCTSVMISDKNIESPHWQRPYYSEKNSIPLRSLLAEAYSEHYGALEILSKAIQLKESNSSLDEIIMNIRNSPYRFGFNSVLEEFIKKDKVRVEKFLCKFLQNLKECMWDTKEVKNRMSHWSTAPVKCRGEHAKNLLKLLKKTAKEIKEIPSLSLFQYYGEDGFGERYQLHSFFDITNRSGYWSAHSTYGYELGHNGFLNALGINEISCKRNYCLISPTRFLPSM